MATIFEPIPRQTEVLAKMAVDSAIKVHSFLGPGLLESAYRPCLAQEIALRGTPVETEVALPLVYEGMKLDEGYRMDIVVARQIVIEAKSLEAINPVHEAQILTYLKLSGYRLGFLLNFNVTLMREGIRRFVV